VVRPMYRSEVVLFYRPSPGASFVAQTEGDPTGQLAARLKEMLFTRERLASLIKEFHLYPDQVRRTGLLDAARTCGSTTSKFQSSGGETFRISFEDEIPQQGGSGDGAGGRDVAGSSPHWRRRMWSRPSSSSTLRSVRPRKCCGRGRRNLPSSWLGIPRWPWPWGLARGARCVCARGEFRVQDKFAGRVGVQAGGARRPAARSGREPAKPESAPKGPCRWFPSIRRCWRSGRQPWRTSSRPGANLAQKQKQFTAEYPDVRLANAAATTARERLRKVEDAIAAAKKAGAPRLRRSPSPRWGRWRPIRPAVSVCRRWKSSSFKRAPRYWNAIPTACLKLSTRLAELDRRVSESRDRLAVIQSKQFQASLEATLDCRTRPASWSWSTPPSCLPDRNAAAH